MVVMIMKISEGSKFIKRCLKMLASNAVLPFSCLMGRFDRFLIIDLSLSSFGDFGCGSHSTLS
jgi:hypothetical protein